MKIYIRRILAEIYILITSLWKIRRIIRSPLNAIRFLDEKAPDNFEGRFRSRRGNFICRKQDRFGIFEIFIDNEYLPVLDCIEGTSTPTVIDLGSNIGGFALYIFDSYPQAKVVSVEVALDTFKILKRNQELNAERDWDILQAAVWTKNGYVNLDRRDTSTGHRVAEDENGSESVVSRLLDGILKEAGINEISLLKMDIEGAESEVVPVNEKVFLRTQILVIEIHTDRIDPVPVYEVLAKCFSHCWKLIGRNVQKPVFILAHKELQIPDTQPVSLLSYIDAPSEEMSI